ncbi:hypothetical protein TNCV_2685581 [Trichonephila clavipes]|nr:hypothetical protein TNCV_2685581 [Trichonephila clavipes]
MACVSTIFPSKKSIDSSRDRIRNLGFKKEIYPTRRQPNHQTFTRVHQDLAELGSFGATIDDPPVNSEMDLVASISIAAATIYGTPDHVFGSLQKALKGWRFPDDDEKCRKFAPQPTSEILHSGYPSCC